MMCAVPSSAMVFFGRRAFVPRPSFFLSSQTLALLLDRFRGGEPAGYVMPRQSMGASVDYFALRLLRSSS